MKFKLLLILPFCMLLGGCTTLYRTSPTYEKTLQETKVIGVMPIDVRMYQLKTGHTREEMDEWSTLAQEYITKSLQAQLPQVGAFQIKFIDEAWLREQNSDLWLDNKALFNAVSGMAATTSFPKEHALFPTKKETFDYTLGSEAAQLATLCGVDTMLFVSGFDHDSTTGRMVLGYFNAVIMGTLTGVYYVPVNPSALYMGLVNGNTGSLDWMKATPAEAEYSYRNEEHVNTLIEWMLKEFGTNAKK